MRGDSAAACRCRPAHLTAMISACSPVGSTPARARRRRRPVRGSRHRLPIFSLLLLACLALWAADVAWACQSPDQAHLPSQTNMLAAEALDPKGAASPGDGAPGAAEAALKTADARYRCPRGDDRSNATKSRAACANLARAPPSARAKLCWRFGSVRCLRDARARAAVIAL
jgi:hypothetical protein